MNEIKKQYGLFTAITMIVGIVIGSGIFFKSDNILTATNGNIGQGIILFCVASVAIIFGSLCIAVLANKSDNPGGIVNYAFEFLKPAVGAGYGWFQNFVYLPTITVILAWLAAIYTGQLFGLELTLLQQCLIGAGYMTFLFVVNAFSAKLSGLFQNAATIIKLIPLLLIGGAGILYGNADLSMNMSQTAVGTNNIWFFAIPAVAFSFDGWIISTGIAHEIKDSKKNLPLALTISPLIILAIYVLYFTGISKFLGPDTIIAMGDDHLNYAAGLLFGSVGQSLLGAFILISVLGGLNGLTIGISQMPYSLAFRQMVPDSKRLVQINKKLSFPINSAVYAYVTCLIWFVIHYLTMNYELLYNSDISEIAIVVSYLMYLPLYWKVFQMRRKGELSFFRGTVCPILGAIGSCIIFAGGLQSSMFISYIIFCMVFYLAGYYYYKNKLKNGLVPDTDLNN